MSDFWIKKDGIVGHWARWYILMTALTVCVFYSLRAAFRFLMSFSNHPLTVDWALDPRFLVYLIPLGIFWGEGLYERDLKVNGPKTPPDKKNILNG